jgi:hypothetical protein
MFRTILSHRRREDARVDAFLDAIALTGRGHTLDPHWQLQHVEDDVQPLPLELVQLMVPAAAQ